MKITKEDIQGLNTHGYQYTVDEYGYMIIDLPHAIITVHKRPYYCDRGRFGFLAQVKKGFHHKLNIDHSDGFPRYFFNLQRAWDELNDWVVFNKNILGIKEDEKEKFQA